MPPELLHRRAPKCGTTSLSYYLSEHPEIFVSWPKEPHYFCTDLPRRRQVRHESDYLRLFANAPPSVRRLGEASTWYLYSRTAAVRIREFMPSARLIVMLRNPVDLLYSLHWQFLYDAARTRNERFESKWAIQVSETNPGRLTYPVLGRLGDHLTRWLRVFPRDQVHVLLLDDLKADARAAYQGVLGFLGVKDDGREQFPVKNESKRAISPRLMQFARQTPKAIALPVEWVKKALGVRRIGLFQKVQRWNTQPAERRPLSSSFRAELQDYFREDVGVLERLLDRDLGDWLRHGASNAPFSDR